MKNDVLAYTTAQNSAIGWYQGELCVFELAGDMSREELAEHGIRSVSDLSLNELEQGLKHMKAMAKQFGEIMRTKSV